MFEKEKISKKSIIKEFKRSISKWEAKSKPYVEDLEKAQELLDKAVDKADKKRNGVLRDIWDNLQSLFNLFSDWINGNYKDISKQSIILVTIGIVYFVSPADLIPDFILGIGFLDDATILGFVIKQIGFEIDKYNDWKKSKI